MKNFKNLLIFLTFFLFGFLFWSIAGIYLKHSPKLFNAQKDEFVYFDINLNRIFKTHKQQKKVNILNSSLNRYSLKGLYQDKKKGFVILEKNSKTYFVDLNSSIDGFKLIKINQNSAIFEKNSKKFVLTFKKINIPNTISEEPKINIVSKKTFEYYKRNPSKIWREIGIIKSQNGYKITYVKPNSIFQKLGLKRGDILLEVNSIELKNDSDAWRAYNSVTKYNFVNLKIQRNNKIKVIHYEIN
jgi:general secretion pathway protein C